MFRDSSVVERLPVKQMVVGPNPTPGAMKTKNYEKCSKCGMPYYAEKAPLPLEKYAHCKKCGAWWDNYGTNSRPLVKVTPLGFTLEELEVMPYERRKRFQSV